MLQSQVGSARCNAKGSAPVKGVRVRDYPLFDAEGSAIEISSFRGRRNVVLLFAGTRETGELVAGRLAGLDKELLEKDAVAIVILAGEPAWASGLKSIQIASDPAGEAHKEISGGTLATKFVQACYITDKFGEVYAALREIPPAVEILSWLDYINAECPECEPPEWPSA